MTDSNTCEDPAFKVVDDKVNTLVSNTNTGQKDVPTTLRTVNVEGVLNQDVKLQSEIVPCEEGHPDISADPGQINNLEKISPVLEDTPTEIVSFHATGHEDPNDDDLLSSTVNVNQEIDSEQQPEPFPGQNGSDSQSDLLDRNNNSIVFNKSDTEHIHSNRESEIRGDREQEGQKTPDNHTVSPPQNKYLELAMVELQPMSKPAPENDTVGALSGQTNIASKSQTDLITPNGETSMVHKDTVSSISLKDNGEDVNAAGQPNIPTESDQTGNQKGTNYKRSTAHTKLKSQLIEINERGVDSRPLNHVSEQNKSDQSIKGHRSSSKANSFIRDPVTYRDAKVDPTSDLPLNRNPQKGGAVLITPASRPNEERDIFADERKSSHRKCQGDGCQNLTLVDSEHYVPFARKSHRKQSNSSQTTSESPASPRPSVSVYERPYTKQELRRALPRRSSFNCHEKAMKDAGYGVDDPVARRKAERLKAKLDRIAKEFDPLPSKALIEAGKEQSPQGAMQSGGIAEKPDVLSENESLRLFDKPSEAVDVVADSNDNAEDAGEKVTPTDPNTMKTHGHAPKKRRPGSPKYEHVECRPLSFYLEYIKDNRQEYLQYLHTSRLPARDKPIANLIKMGRAFELRHLGGRSRHQDENVVVMAAKSLRPRTADPAKICHSPKDKGLWPAETGIRPLRPQTEDKRQTDKASTPNSNTTTAAAKEEEHPKTELEKRKLKAEDWSRSVSTNLLTRAKIQSLRELGSDDDEMTKWWEAFKHCHYIRQSHS